jgi:hypothetical protein
MPARLRLAGQAIRDAPVRSRARNNQDRLRSIARDRYAAARSAVTPRRARRGHRDGLGAALLLAMTLPLASASPTPDAAAVRIATDRWLGPYATADFAVTTGDGAKVHPAAKLYFAKEWIAIPQGGVAVATVTPGLGPVADVQRWVASTAGRGAPEYPSLVWLGDPQLVTGARLATDLGSLTVGGATLPFALTPKLELNRSWFDSSSAAFFVQRPLTVRGEMQDGRFVGRTLWPEDFRLDVAQPAVPLPGGTATQLALRGEVRATPDGGAREPFATRVIWERDPGRRQWQGRPALVVMVNGAQGDDDESWGGHFAIGTGTLPGDGGLADLLINNFYSLDVVSEKGILAAPVPLDNYLADLNSGQGWYRPSWMIVAVLANARAPALVQAALNRVYNQFWRHQLVYRHATMNCASISVDVLRRLGWEIPARGPAGRLAAALAFPYVAVKERSIAKACTTFDYLWEDQTRLLPAVAFEEIGSSLIALATRPPGSGRVAGSLADWVASDVESILFVRFPQFPSSRAFGDAPAVSPREYRARLPAVPQIVPVPARPFPAALRDPDLLPPPRPASAYAAILWGTLLVVGIPIFLWRQWTRWRERSASR